MILAILMATPMGPTDADSAQTRSKLGRAIHGVSSPWARSHWLTVARAERVAALLRTYGRKWQVDPWLAASVAYHESRYKDRPRRVLVKRCKSKWFHRVGNLGSFQPVCRLIWPGERGILQVVPAYARASWRACKGTKRWRREVELEDTATNICVSLHLMASRRARVQRRIRHRITFVSMWPGRRRRWRRDYGPCTSYQRRWCAKWGTLCKRLWWIASWNWGSHRQLCSNSFGSSYPVRVLRLYRRMEQRFRRANVIKRAYRVQKGDNRGTTTSRRGAVDVAGGRGAPR